MWLVLTNKENIKVRVNMKVTEDYRPNKDGKTDGFQSFVGLNGEYHEIKETCEEIDNAMNNAASPLRLVKLVTPVAAGWGK